ncbi:MAG: hypothetical protein AVDCRST_MAG38-2491, partial [uncultured Solirubrobacteraceae bacterium]
GPRRPPAGDPQRVRRRSQRAPSIGRARSRRRPAGPAAPSRRGARGTLGRARARGRRGRRGDVPRGGVGALRHADPLACGLARRSPRRRRGRGARAAGRALRQVADQRTGDARARRRGGEARAHAAGRHRRRVRDVRAVRVGRPGIPPAARGHPAGPRSVRAGLERRGAQCRAGGDVAPHDRAGRAEPAASALPRRRDDLPDPRRLPRQHAAAPAGTAPGARGAAAPHPRAPPPLRRPDREPAEGDPALGARGVVPPAGDRAGARDAAGVGPLRDGPAGPPRRVRGGSAHGGRRGAGDRRHTRPRNPRERVPARRARPGAARELGAVLPARHRRDAPRVRDGRARGHRARRARLGGDARRRGAGARRGAERHRVRRFLTLHGPRGRARGCSRGRRGRQGGGSALRRTAGRRCARITRRDQPSFCGGLSRYGEV